MERLSGDEQRSVLLAYYEGYTHSEMAARLATPLGTVKSWVRRGLQQLRDCLGSA
jgi:RNA polymerase sigma-70 factor (ECF subfamily)